jgi:hypothetical protein
MVVVLQELKKEGPEVALIQHDDMVQALLVDNGATALNTFSIVPSDGYHNAGHLLDGGDNAALGFPLAVRGSFRPGPPPP